MKFLAVLASIVVAVTAQTASIAYPSANTTVSPGQNITVQINRSTTTSTVDDVAIVLAVGHCYNNPCDNSERLGAVVYSGPFDPQYPTIYDPQNEVPQQNFTVQIPVGTPTGEATLTLVRLALIGGGPSPVLETHNITLNVQ